MSRPSTPAKRVLLLKRLATTGRMMELLHPDGIPAGQVAESVRHAALCDLLAESVASGTPVIVPLALIGDPRRQLLDVPIGFVPTEEGDA